MDVKSSGTGIGVLTLYHDFMFPSKLAVLEQSGLNLEDLDNFWTSLPSLNIAFWTVLAPKNQEQTSFAVEIENIRTQWYVMTALLSLETKLNPFRCRI